MINLLATTVDCGTGVTIPNIIPNLVHLLVLFIQIFIPIILIVLGMLDMGKAVLSNDEKTMKEAQGRLIKRIIYAVVVFLIVSIVTIVINFVAKAANDSDDSSIDDFNITKCVACFTSGTDSSGCKATKKKD